MKKIDLCEFNKLIEQNKDRLPILCLHLQEVEYHEGRVYADKLEEKISHRHQTKKVSFRLFYTKLLSL